MRFCWDRWAPLARTGIGFWLELDREMRIYILDGGSNVRYSGGVLRVKYCFYTMYGIYDNVGAIANAFSIVDGKPHYALCL